MPTELSPLKQARRERLLDAAEKLFHAEGFRGASMEQLARAAGMSKVTLYGYFPDKQAAFLAVAQRFADRLEADFRTKLAAKGKLVARVSAALVAKHQAVADLVRRSREAHDLFNAQAQIAGGIFLRLDETMIADLAATLRSEGRSDPERLSRLLFASAQGVANAAPLDDMPDDVDLVVRRVLAG